MAIPLPTPQPPPSGTDDPWSPFFSLALDRLVYSTRNFLPQTLGMEFAYGCPGFAIKTERPEVNVKAILRMHERLSDGTGRTPVEYGDSKHTIIRRFLSGGEQFAHRIKRRRGYYPAVAQKAILDDPQNASLLKECYAGRRVNEFMIGNGLTSFRNHMRMKEAGYEPHSYLVNDIEPESLAHAKAILGRVARVEDIHGDIHSGDFWKAFAAQYNPDPGIPAVYPILGNSVCNDDEEQLIGLLSKMRPFVRPPDPLRGRPGDRVVWEIDFTRHLSTLKMGYNHYYYDQIFASGAVFAPYLLGAINPNYDAIGVRRDFDIEKNGGIRFNVTNSKEQILERQLGIRGDDSRLPGLSTDKNLLWIKQGEMASGRMNRWPETKWNDEIFKPAGFNWVAEAPYRPDQASDHKHIDQRLVVLEAM